MYPADLASHFRPPLTDLSAVSHYPLERDATCDAQQTVALRVDHDTLQQTTLRASHLATMQPTPDSYSIFSTHVGQF